MVIVSALLISGYTKPIIYDQVIATYSFEKGYPGISSGIVSHLLIGLYNAVVDPSPAAQNEHIKIFIMIIFMTSAFLVAREILKSNILTGMFLLILLFSRYPFLWLSTELIVASMLFFSIWAMSRNSHPVLISFFLVLLCFSKPELILITLVLLGYQVVKTRKSKRALVMLLAGFVLFSGIILSPGVLKQGGKYFSGANRSMFSFGQHYAALVNRHQVNRPAPHPWDEYNKYLDANFGGARNMLEVCLKYPLKYFDFLLLSAGHGALKAAALLHFFLILLLMMAYRYIKEKVKPLPAEKMIYLSFVGILPLIMLSYPHIRYLARYYPLVIILILLFLQRLIAGQAEGNPVRSNAVKVAVIFLVLGILINVILFSHDLVQFETLKDFWFPD